MLQVHRDTDMALGVLITTALFFVVVMVPIIGLAGIFMLPLPTLIYRLKLGRVKAVIMTAVSFAITAGVLGTSADLFLFLVLLLLGFVLGESFERNLSVERTVGVACGALTVGGVILLFFYSRTAGVGIPDLVSAYVKEILSLYEAAVNRMDASEETMQAIKASLEVLDYLLVRILPGIVVSGLLFMAWMTLLLAKPILQRLRLPYPVFGPLIEWRAPEMLVWGVIGCGILTLLTGWVKMVGVNGLLVLMQVYFFQGIAIVAFFFEKKRVPWMLRWGLYTLMTLQFLLLLMVVALGFFDMWLNVRRWVAGRGDGQ